MSTSTSIDKLLNDKAKVLKPGESITFTIIKGAVTNSSLHDIIKNNKDNNNNNTNTGNNDGNSNGNGNKNSNGNGKSNSNIQQQEKHKSNTQSQSLANNSNSNNKDNIQFPRIAKFGESVVKPDFTKDLSSKNNDNNHVVRMYEQDIPKIKSESDEESDADNMSNARKRKKRKYKRKEGPRRQWVLESSLASSSKSADSTDKYVGITESNLSNYMLLCSDAAMQHNDDDDDVTDNNNNNNKQNIIKVIPIPRNGFYSFTKPSRAASLSMSEAEAAIENQRANLTRYIMHGKLKETNVNNKPNSANKNKPKASKTRLLGKLISQDENDPDFDDNDVMGDLSFKNRKATTARARKELLSDLADENVTVDGDGVIGGANDGEFGGSRRFAKMASSKKQPSSSSSKSKKQQRSNTSSSAAGATFEAAALQDDFYQRDVAAEYEDLDFDANEQFDDDDVDVSGDGDNFQFNDNTNNNDRSDDDNDDELDSSDDENETIANNSLSNNGGGGGGGLATAAGMRAMMAKARGDDENNALTNNPNAATNILDSKGKKSTAYNRPNEPPGSFAASSATAKATTIAPNPTDTDNNNTNASSLSSSSSLKNPPSNSLQQVMDAASKATLKAENKNSSQQQQLSSPDKNTLRPTVDETTGVERDESGKRLITLQAIRREIWLHHGQIRMKRLMKIFSIKKNMDPTRYNKFRDLVKELCTMKVDKVDGNMLVLKQHWSNMG